MTTAKNKSYISIRSKRKKNLLVFTSGTPTSDWDLRGVGGGLASDRAFSLVVYSRCVFSITGPPSLVTFTC